MKAAKRKFLPSRGTMIPVEADFPAQTSTARKRHMMCVKHTRKTVHFGFYIWWQYYLRNKRRNKDILKEGRVCVIEPMLRGWLKEVLKTGKEITKESLKLHGKNEPPTGLKWWLRRKLLHHLMRCTLPTEEICTNYSMFREITGKDIQLLKF